MSGLRACHGPIERSQSSLEKGKPVGMVLVLEAHWRCCRVMTRFGVRKHQRSFTELIVNGLNGQRSIFLRPIIHQHIRSPVLCHVLSNRFHRVPSYLPVVSLTPLFSLLTEHLASAKIA